MSDHVTGYDLPPLFVKYNALADLAAAADNRHELRAPALLPAPGAGPATPAAAASADAAAVPAATPLALPLPLPWALRADTPTTAVAVKAPSTRMTISSPTSDKPREPELHSGLCTSMSGSTSRGYSVSNCRCQKANRPSVRTLRSAAAATA